MAVNPLERSKFTASLPGVEERPIDKISSHAYDRGKIYIYGSLVLNRDRKAFYKSKKHEEAPYTKQWEPNVWVWQYDLEIHIFLNYEELNLREIEALKDQRDRLESDIGEAIGQKKMELINLLKSTEDRLELVRKKGFTGITRQEHFWNAAHIRWPERLLPNGRSDGLLVRHRWSEDFVDGLCESRFVCMFGGAGQGKTHTPAAFMIMMWDHFIYDFYGAKCSLSTVNDKKLSDAAWPMIERLYFASNREEFSLYAGKGHKGGGEYTIVRKREDTKKMDTGCRITGILIKQGDKSNSSVDKLTGSHGHPLYIYIMDEAQSTSDAPIIASKNFMLNPRFSWVILSGNYGEDHDLLAKNVCPKEGWSSVTEETHIWRGNVSSLSESLGDDTYVIHYNNNLSPGMEEPIRLHFLPTKAKKDSLYKEEKGESYRRFWVGWREDGKFGNYVLSMEAMISGRSIEAPRFSQYYPKLKLISFDSAPMNNDRNPILHAEVGVEEDTDKQIIHLERFSIVAKNANSLDYYKKSIQEINHIARSYGVQKDGIILDHSQNLSHYESLSDLGWFPFPVKYGASIPSGKRVDSTTKRKTKPIFLDDYGQYAHQLAFNQSSLGAWALKEYVKHGHVRGMNQGILSGTLGDNHGFDAEFLQRSYNRNKMVDGFDVLMVDSKRDFISKNNFSPDLLDTIIQLCYYLLVYKRFIPGKGMEIELLTESEEEDEYFSSLETMFSGSYLEDFNQFD